MKGLTILLSFGLGALSTLLIGYLLISDPDPQLQLKINSNKNLNKLNDDTRINNGLLQLDADTNSHFQVEALKIRIASLERELAIAKGSIDKNKESLMQNQGSSHVSKFNSGPSNSDLPGSSSRSFFGFRRLGEGEEPRAEDMSSYLTIPRPTRRPTLKVTSHSDFVSQHPDILTQPIRICLVTSAIAGPTMNGGIATAFYSLAQHLAQSKVGGDRKFQVTILYAAHPYYASHNAEYWTSHFASLGMDFLPLVEAKTKFYGPKFVVRAYRIFDFLREKENEFDIISYHDYMANGYYLALAKHQKLAFQNVFLFVQCHSTTRWADTLNHRPPKDHNTLAYYYMEQKSIEYADARVSPSRYYLEWMQDEGFYDLSKGLSFVVQNLMYPLPSDAQSVRLYKSSHFVFFARLEVRKGLMVFLDALDHLHNSNNLPQEVTFIGPEVSIDNSKSGTVISKRYKASEWNFKLNLEHKFDTNAALKFIKDSGAIVVLPTLGDNSPYALMEIVAHNIPVLTTDAGGGLELLDPATHSSIISKAGDAVALASLMASVMLNGVENVKMSTGFSKTRDDYITLLHSFRAYKGILKKFKKQPGHHKVTIGITSHNRPDSLLQAVDAVSKQTYPSHLMELVIADDASDDPAMPQAFKDIEKTLASVGIKYNLVVSNNHTFVAITRNMLIEYAARQQSDYVCFMDDDDIALPYMLSVYMHVADATDADILTDFSDNYDLDEHGNPRLSHRSIAVGDAFAHNFFINNYGKANFCVKPRSALRIGGHQTGAQSNSPYVDWGFFTRASLNDLSIELVPLALYRYTKHSKGSIWYGMTSQENKYNGHGKMLRDFEELLPEKFRDILHMCRYKLAFPAVTADGPL